MPYNILMFQLNWKGRPLRPVGGVGYIKVYKPDINELMKPLSQKAGLGSAILTGNIINPINRPSVSPVPVTPSPTPSVTPSLTPTQTITPTITSTVTPSVTPSSTPVLDCYWNTNDDNWNDDSTLWNDCVNVPTPTPSPTNTSTPTNTQTPSVSPTMTVTPTNTNTPTPSTTPPFDADADAYLKAVVDTGLGTGITSVESGATTNMFIDLKNAGLYSKIYAFYPMLGGKSTSCRYNAKNPLNTDAAFRLTFTAGVSFGQSFGIQGNGTTSAADSYFNPTTQSAATDNFCLSTFITVSGTSGYEIGGASGSGWYYLSGREGGQMRGQIEGNVLGTSLDATPNPINFQAISRTGSTQVQYVKAGGNVTTLSLSSPGGIPNVNLQLLVLGGHGASSNKSIGTSVFSQGLSIPELTNLRDIITTFETAINRDI